MWMLDLQGKCIYRRYMIATYIYIYYICIYIVREKTKLYYCVHLRGLWEVEKGKKMLENEIH
jgi:hypothetical protein